MNVWQKILKWFKDFQERKDLIDNFNHSAKNAFVAGYIPVILEASISRGERKYRHQYSAIFSGFRIKAYSGIQLSKEDLIKIGNVIITNPELVRKLVILGFDTLEIHCDIGDKGCRWQLRDHMALTFNSRDFTM